MMDQMYLRDIDFSLPGPHLPICDQMLLFVNKKRMTWYCISFASQDDQIPLACSLTLLPPHFPPLLTSMLPHARIVCWFACQPHASILSPQLFLLIVPLSLAVPELSNLPSLPVF